MTSVDSSEEKFKFPDCWSDNMRMNALFAPFRSKSLNPNDWDSKMKFWMSLIESWCKFHKCPVVEISILKNSFSRKGLPPVCLDEVLQHMSRTGIIIDKYVFMSENESWKAWAIKVLVANPLKWTLNTVKGAIIKQNEQKEITFIHLPVVKFLGEDLIKNIPESHKGKAVSLDVLQKEIKNGENLSLVLHWLQKQGIIGLYSKEDFDLVKFSGNNQTNVNITEADVSVYMLERQQKLLGDSINKLESEKTAALEETKKHLAAKMKNLAMISLRRKHAIEKNIEKRMVLNDNIQEILHRIEQAKFDSEVFKCYQQGSMTIKEMYKNAGLNEKSVAETLNEVKDVLESQNEIEEALSQTMDSALEKDLLDDLNELLLEEAPEVPANEISTTDGKKSKAPKDLPSKMEALSL